MKKSLLMMLAAGGLMLTACSNDPEDITSSFVISTSNLVTNLTTGEAEVYDTQYSCEFNGTQGTAYFATDNVTLDGTTFSLKTNPIAYTTYNYTNGRQTVIVKNATGNVGNQASLAISDATFEWTTNYYIDNLNIPGYNATNVILPKLVSQYKVGEDYEVKTFSRDSFYGGQTTTSYPGTGGETATYETEDMTYRIVINQNFKSADMIIYNAKFSASEREPVKQAIVAKNIPLEFSNGTYVIKGENIVPEVLEAGNLIPYSDFTFNNIDIQMTSANLTNVKINFQVATVFFGSFEGSYIIQFKS